MNKEEHGERLARAIGAARLSRTAVADAAGVKPRTVTNWTSGATMPSERERDALRRILGHYDSEGDQVEIALRQSELTEDRQHIVLGTYKRLLREQREAAAS